MRTAVQARSSTIEDEIISVNGSEPFAILFCYPRGNEHEFCEVGASARRLVVLPHISAGDAPETQSSSIEASDPRWS